MNEPDFSGLSDFDLILMRHAVVEAGFEEDKEYIKVIDTELRRRIKVIDQTANGICPHGWQDWDNCPVCGH